MIKVRTTAGRTCADCRVPGKTRQGLCIYCEDPSDVLPADLFPVQNACTILSSFFHSEVSSVWYSMISFLSHAAILIFQTVSQFHSMRYGT